MYLKAENQNSAQHQIRASSSLLMQQQLKDGKTVWTVSKEMHFLATTEKNPLLLDSVGQLFLATEENPRLLELILLLPVLVNFFQKTRWEDSLESKLWTVLQEMHFLATEKNPCLLDVGLLTPPPADFFTRWCCLPYFAPKDKRLRRTCVCWTLVTSSSSSCCQRWSTFSPAGAVCHTLHKKTNTIKKTFLFYSYWYIIMHNHGINGHWSSSGPLFLKCWPL